MKRSLLGIILACVAFGCDTTDPNAPKSQVITGSKWLFDGATSDDPDIGSLFPLLAGSTYSFRSDHTYTFIMQGVGAVGTWEITSDDTYLILGKGTPDERTLKLVKLDPANFHFEEDDGTFITKYYYRKTT